MQMTESELATALGDHDSGSSSSSLPNPSSSAPVDAADQQSIEEYAQ